MDLRCQDWMSDLPEQLWDIPLSELAIPGSHDAMSYCLDINSPLVPSESDSFRLLDRLFYCFTRPLIFKWTTTQDKSIEEQLSMGIRFFDLRIAHKPNDSSTDLYFTHIIYTHLTVLETLLSVATWLDSHPKEIVILACSHFEGIDDRLHHAFTFSLKKLFGSKLCSRTESVPTLRSLWSSGYQVILSYDSQTAESHQELWPDIPYWWANQHTAQGVICYLECKKDLGRPELGFTMSSMCELSLGELPMESWMSHLPAALWDTPLHHLAIPGSHNAITYCLDMNDGSPVDLTQPDMLQKLDKYMKPLIRPFVYKWAITQEFTIKQQLDCGVRYCDLRIAHRPNDSSTNLYFYHGVYTTLTVETVLTEIKEWLDDHPKEVVILSFSHFLGLNQELHTLLLTTLRNIFTSKLCPKTELLTLRNLWALGCSVIVSYEHNVVSCHGDLWPHIPYWWANKCKAEALIEAFEHRKKHGRPGFFVTGINLTEDLKYICTHPTESLKDLVMSTYPTLLSWVKEQNPGSKVDSLNIIAGDFITESHFVPTVVALNEKLLKWSS